MPSKKDQTPQNEHKNDSPEQQRTQQRFVGILADELAKTLAQRLPNMLSKRKGKKSVKRKQEKIEKPYFLDTSAIIDGRIFDVIELGLLWGTLVVPACILSELKHIADSQDMVKRERGQRGLLSLEKIKKVKHIKFLFFTKDELVSKKELPVDDRLIQLAKQYKGRIVTCDYNLEKKASVSGVVSVNVHELANRLKIIAVPGESLHLTIQHIGKNPTQGVGYLEDGTMVVVEHAAPDITQSVNVVITRVIATSSGRILFAKKV